MASTPPHILIVEIVNADQFPGRISSITPLLIGYFNQLQLPTRWVRFGISTTNLLVNQCDQITLNEDELAFLLTIVKNHQPKYIFFTDSLTSSQMNCLRNAALNASFYFYQQDEFVGLPGYRRFKAQNELDDPDFQPYYRWEVGNRAAEAKEIDNIYLIINGGCGHYKTVRNNPFYPESIRVLLKPKIGCLFCDSRSHWLSQKKQGVMSTATPVGWIDKQIQGILQSRGATNLPNALLFERVERQEIVHACFEAMDSAGMTGKVRLSFGLRTNHSVAFKQLVTQYFSRYPDSSMKIGVHGSGIESFSEYDLLLFNKGTTSLDGLRTVNILRELRDRFPENFSYTGLSFILFTPWTSLENLHLNVGLYRLMGLSRKEAGNFFQARIRLHKSLPLTNLARHNNLLEGQENDTVLVMNRRKLFDSEQAWRFADVRLRPLSRIVLRFDFLDGSLSDSLTQMIEQYFKRFNSGWKLSQDRYLLHYLLHFIDVAALEKDALDERELLQRGLELWLTKKHNPLIQNDAKRFRLGEQKVSLLEYLNYLVPFVEKGVKPVLSVENVTETDLSADVTDYLSSLDITYFIRKSTAESRNSRDILYMASDRNLLDELLFLQEQLPLTKDSEKYRDIVFRIGILYGYPQCCAHAYAECIFAKVNLPVWSLFYKRLNEPGEISTFMQPLLVPALSFTPCSMQCKEAMVCCRQCYDHLVPSEDIEEKEEIAHLFSLDPAGVDDYIALRVCGRDANTLHYDSGVIKSGSKRVLQLLQSGNMLQFVPGQIRINKDDRLLGWLTATHGVWSRYQCWHPAEWVEIARGRLFMAKRKSNVFDQQEGNRTSSLFVDRACTILEDTKGLVHKYSGFIIKEIFPGENSIRVQLESEESQLIAIIVPAADGRQVFKKGKFCGVFHGSETPADSRNKRAVLECILFILEKAAMSESPLESKS